MIDVITKIFCALLCGFMIDMTYNSICIGKINKVKKIISIICLSITIYLSYFITYNTEITILKTTAFIIIFKLIYNESLYKTICFTFISILLISISDIISNIILNNFVNITQARGIWYIILIGNLLVFILTIILIKLPIIKKALEKIVKKINYESRLSTILILLLVVIVIFYSFYNISLNYNWSEKYFINIVITISYIIISVIFFRNKLKYDLLEEKYDALFEYFSDISENIDELNLTTHEYKNQIAIVGNYIDNKKYKKAKEYINDIASSINKDEGLLVNLSDIPNGGLKGLLYYKIIVAKNQKVEIVLDVGKNVKRNLNKLSEDEIKIITRIIGVYIDNAVSASKNKIINIEIYNLDDELYFTISNKIDKNVNIDNIGKKGFTTKEKGHGKGIYLTNRLIARNKWLKSENRIVNNYYICKLIIDTKNIGN